MARITSTSIFLAALCLALSFARDASAQAPAPVPMPAGIDPIDIPPEHDPLAHAWDRPGDRGGFYLRGSLGLGYMAGRLGPAPWDDHDYDARVARGFGTGFTLDVGAMLAPWVALHVNGHVGMLWNGNLDYEFYYDQHDSGARIAAYGVAPAVTFFTPYDFFFTAAFGVGFGHSQYGGYSKSTNPGFYMNLVSGKDLYVSSHLAVGIQFQIVYMLLGDEDASDELRVREFIFGPSVAFDSI